MDPVESETLQAGISLLEHPKFAWKCGMKTACGTRMRAGWTIKTWIKSFDKDDSPIPDLNDPSTKGCLLDAVRTISKDESAYVAKFDEGWSVVVWPEPNRPTYHATEGLALANFIIESPRFI